MFIRTSFFKERQTLLISSAKCGERMKGRQALLSLSVKHGKGMKGGRLC